MKFAIIAAFAFSTSTAFAALPKTVSIETPAPEQTIVIHIGDRIEVAENVGALKKGPRINLLEQKLAKGRAILQSMIRNGDEDYDDFASLMTDPVATEAYLAELSAEGTLRDDLIANSLLTSSIKP